MEETRNRASLCPISVSTSAPITKKASFNFKPVSSSTSLKAPSSGVSSSWMCPPGKSHQSEPLSFSINSCPAESRISTFAVICKSTISDFWKSSSQFRTASCCRGTSGGLSTLCWLFLPISACRVYLELSPLGEDCPNAVFLISLALFNCSDSSIAKSKSSFAKLSEPLVTLVLSGFFFLPPPP